MKFRLQNLRLKQRRLALPSSEGSPLNGINWRELRLAYATFLADASTGIRHILLAQQHSRWQRSVNRRLSRQAAHLAGKTVSVDLTTLAQLPPHTLGGAYGRHMLKLRLDPNAFISEQLTENWLDQRTAIYHDIHHIIAGFDASPLGEFGVAAFAMVQYGDLLNLFVLSFVPLSLTNPRWTIPLLRNLWRGFRLGIRCQPVIAYAVEENWAKPLVMVRQELGIADFWNPTAQHRFSRRVIQHNHSEPLR